MNPLLNSAATLRFYELGTPTYYGFSALTATGKLFLIVAIVTNGNENIFNYYVGIESNPTADEFLNNWDNRASLSYSPTLSTAVFQGVLQGFITSTSSTSGLATEATLSQLQTAFGLQQEAVATNDTGAFKFMAFIKRISQTLTGLNGKIKIGPGLPTEAQLVTLSATGVGGAALGAPDNALLQFGTISINAAVKTQVALASMRPAILGSIAVNGTKWVRLPKICAQHRFFIRGSNTSDVVIRLWQNTGDSGPTNGVIDTSSTPTGNFDDYTTHTLPYTSGGYVSGSLIIANTPMFSFVVENKSTASITVTYLGY